MLTCFLYPFWSLAAFSSRGSIMQSCIQQQTHKPNNLQLRRGTCVTCRKFSYAKLNIISMTSAATGLDPTNARDGGTSWHQIAPDDVKLQGMPPSRTSNTFPQSDAGQRTARRSRDLSLLRSCISEEAYEIVGKCSAALAPERRLDAVPHLINSWQPRPLSPQTTGKMLRTC